MSYSETKIELGCGISFPLRYKVIDTNRGVIILSSGFGINHFEEPVIAASRSAIEKAGGNWIQYIYPERVAANHIEDMTILGGVHSLRNVLRLARSLASSKIGLLGISYGASISLEVSMLETISSVVALNTPFDYTHYRRTQLGEEAFKRWESDGIVRLHYPPGSQRSSFRFLQEAQRQSLLSRCTNIGIPTLLAQGDKDPIIPSDFISYVSNRNPLVHSFLIRNADHVFDDRESINTFLSSAIPFLLKSL